MRFVAVLALALAPLTAWAAEATPTDLDPVAQKRLIELASELRCLVCQNQTIADSNAGLAVDLRRQIREQITVGRTNVEIIDYMTARYGDFVLYRPPFKATTALLWSGPALLLVAGFVVLARVLRTRRRRAGEDRPLTEEEHKRAAALLAGAGAEKDRT